MYYIIDRFEDDFAVIEDENKKNYNIPKSLLTGCLEGDRIIIKKDEDFFKNDISREFNDLFVD